ncbi:interleukin-1 receptor-associated kinase 3 isoform 1 [Mus musculus]|uniref:Interleukin-1 receptor-associated kinase 3 n=3 Tax=Mus musculus TaxID=10090 RepID=IRAK3_MOUSE|nr:interleukin-1 receptor-associated kinase 3 isoform 1 [Mus musculus]Q8K4B2.2 RecName: Full=Interleukin-1 receptor-associated kinase 3; Short=IRAK-3; AltName: Full=IL-1 receptor-associated kinase M; Short=IRAK-M; AltName: Full=Inactive IL-1 receptor-associated kinase 3 [Mus musculus]AAI20830.1 Interleukin-1 receptor-associated kinase 3 [Mus musculus]AAI20832.1 Interleukin-1 receptor-associated kinase 3 [Mus musculus]EDL24398.1 interleukin-1 receptor-associated kinase 3, isoform CRA_a [Mus musc|eukprot:NP_082955.2 interleukin-1 receptor-associated kinase 3 [Mus musculus]
MAGRCGARGALSPQLLLFDLPPALLGELCGILDSCDGPLGWRGLAERLSNSWLDVRHIEKYVNQGKSGTRELLWSWAQKNKTIGDLLEVLQDMGHQRAIHLIINYGVSWTPSVQTHHELPFPSFPPEVKHACRENDPGPLEPANVTVDNVLVPEHNEKGTLQKTPISFQSILEGTKHFHKDFLIGEGEIFEVYRVDIRNQAYAVKLFKQEKKMQLKKHWKRFLSELEVLLLFRHPHILELAAYFTETEKLCLVYPYMSNGTLFDRLQCTNGTTPLSWHVRISVLIGIAKAIQYLHNTQPCAVICGNVSSANILLDDQLQPKLTDFAAAHFRPNLEQQSSTINMTGGGRKHLWYMPEEYIRQGRLSVKTDVYSFGIVIMEVLTGCKVVLDDPKHVQLRDLLMELMEKRGLDSCLSFLDRKIPPCPRNFSAKLFSLAGRCVATKAKLRPTMDEVLSSLESTQPSLYFAEDPPTSLKSFRCPSPLFLDNVPSIPVEDDENQNNHSVPPKEVLGTDRVTQKTPFECSQSEVTFLGLDRNRGNRGSEADCNVPSSSHEECWSPELVAPSQDLSPTVISLGSSWEVPGHSYGSKPMEKRCSSGLFCSEHEQSKKQ